MKKIFYHRNIHEANRIHYILYKISQNIQCIDMVYVHRHGNDTIKSKLFYQVVLKILLKG